MQVSPLRELDRVSLPNLRVGDPLNRWTATHGHIAVFNVPQAYPRLIVLWDILLQLPSNGSFGGAGLAVTQSDVWSETATVAIFDRLRSLIVGRPVSVDADPYTEFSREDFEDYRSLVLLVTLGRWDAMLQVYDGDVRAWISHDGFIDMYWRDAETLNSRLLEAHEAGFECRVAGAHAGSS